MSSARRIVIEFLGQDRGLGSAVTDVDRRTSKLGRSIKKVGLLAGAALAAGAIIAGRAMFGMAKAAAEDQAQQEKLALALKNNANANDAQIASVERWISAQGRALGVTDDELRPALARLVTATHDVGRAQRLAALAMDVSAGTGKSLESVSTALMKAENGQVSALARLGINTKSATGETITMHEAVKRMSATFGGQAAAKAQTFQGKMSRLKLVFDETKEAIGYRLIPVLTKLATWFLTKGLPASQRFGNWLKDNLGPILVSIGTFIRTKVIPAAQQFQAWFMEKIAPAMQRTLRPALAGARDLFDQVSKKIEDNRPQLEKLWDGLRKVTEYIAQHVMPVIGQLQGRNLQLLGVAIGAVIDHIGRMISMFIAAKNAVEDLISAIKSIPTPHIPGAGVLSHIPGLASGGRVLRSGVALVGERGPELVDLPTGSRVIPNHQLGAAGGDAGTITLQVLLDGKIVEQALIKRNRDTGRPLAFRVAT